MLLSIQDLRVAFRMGKGVRAEAVKGVSFDIPENTTVALVGESGSGKSVTAMSVLNLLPDNAERQGRILWQGRDLLQASLTELQALRGKEIACVFQDPMSSLNPVFDVGQQLTEPLMKHLGLSRRQALARAEELLGEVGIPEPKRRLASYPHEMSGGQQQRVMIAMALSCEPRLLIADEPTTALDVTIQRQILELLGKLKTQHRMSVLFISHDLGLVGEIADQVVVMRNGIIREQGPVARIFEAPQDDYTRALLRDVKGLRLGIPKEYFAQSGIDPEVEKAVGKAVRILERQGATLTEITLPHTQYAVAVYYLIAPAEASSNLARYDGVKYGYRHPHETDLRELYEITRSEGFGAEVKRRIMLGTYALSAGYYDAYYRKASQVRTLIRQDFEEAFTSCDLIVTPTAPTPPFCLGEKLNNPLQMYLSDIFTIPANLAGLPGISLPCGFSARGLPVGLQIIGNLFAEEKIIRGAYCLEQNSDWHFAKPSLA